MWTLDKKLLCLAVLDLFAFAPLKRFLNGDSEGRNLEHFGLHLVLANSVN